MQIMDFAPHAVKDERVKGEVHSFVEKLKITSKLLIEFSTPSTTKVFKYFLKKNWIKCLIYLFMKASQSYILTILVFQG